ncbi:60S ribosomal protein l17 [Phtheirospermum japonicum]|uniref:60S ribosomal protein l17 n=1 Tax=Phtheirospermum japonicum TaxID=374723 RepID=A0A830D8T9_9LAMI|nr:60S ribosomal protein l17 [Phtheirospermum japonicum]
MAATGARLGLRGHWPVKSVKFILDLLKNAEVKVLDVDGCTVYFLGFLLEAFSYRNGTIVIKKLLKDFTQDIKTFKLNLASMMLKDSVSFEQHAEILQQ